MSGTQRRGGGAGGERRGRDNRRGQNDRNRNQNEYLERVVAINRVAKVVQGGRRFSFTALVVVGDGEGSVGVGYGKAKEVPAAIAKAVEEAKKHFFKVPLVGRTITHPVIGEKAAGVVMLRPASRRGLERDADAAETCVMTLGLCVGAGFGRSRPGPGALAR